MIWDDHIKAHDEAIRADERKRVGKALEALYKRALRLGEMADALAADLGKFNDAHHPVERSNGSAPQVKAKRKRGPVKADSMAISQVLMTLKNATAPLTLKNIVQATELGPRVIGAALRHLMAREGNWDYTVIEQPKGKFRAVAQPTVADGAGE